MNESWLFQMETTQEMPRREKARQSKKGRQSQTAKHRMAPSSSPLTCSAWNQCRQTLKKMEDSRRQCVSALIIRWSSQGVLMASSECGRCYCYIPCQYFYWLFLLIWSPFVISWLTVNHQTSEQIWTAFSVPMCNSLARNFETSLNLHLFVLIFAWWGILNRVKPL